jgi:hypothetical protein
MATPLDLNNGLEQRIQTHDLGLVRLARVYAFLSVLSGQFSLEKRTIAVVPLSIEVTS